MQDRPLWKSKEGWISQLLGEGTVMRLRNNKLKAPYSNITDKNALEKSWKQNITEK